MKKIKRIKSFSEIKTQCWQQRLRFDASLFHKHGLIAVSGGGALVYYSPFSGRFKGSALLGPHMHYETFDSANSNCDHCDWFQALQRFFYVGVVP